jgi:outer membrane protein assembly factor BamE
MDQREPFSAESTQQFGSFLRILARLPLFGLVLLAGCNAMSNVLPNLTPNFGWVYRIDIQQGAVLTQEMAAQLKPGMTREQVRFVLGSPPVTDIFHADRWDYPYTMQKRGGEIERRNYTVLFEANRVKSFGGDPLPSEKEFGQKVGTTVEAPASPPPRAF